MICLPLHMSMQYVRMYVCLSMGPDGVAEGRKGGVAEGAQAGQDQCHRSLQDGKGIPVLCACTVCMYQHADTTCLHIVLQVCSGQGDHKKAVQYFKLAAAEEPNEKVNMADQLSTRRADLLSVLCLLCV